MAKARKMNRGVTGKVSSHPDNSVKMVVISLGHIISNQIEMRAFCGIEGHQWRYGKVDDVKCTSCIELYEAAQPVAKK